MKNFTFFATFIFFAVSQVLAQEKLLVRANLITGQGSQAGKLPNAVGIGAQYQRDIKNTAFEYIITAETHLNGVKTVPYDLNFNNSITHTDVKYFSTISRLTGGVSYLPFKKRLMTPIISIQAGALSYHTAVRIDDPHDADGCRPIQAKTVKLSVIAIGQIETGMRMYFKKKGKERSFIQAGAGYTAGSRGSYIKLMNGHEHNTAATEYTAKFRNNAGDEHEHSLGRIYRTYTNQLFYSVGFGFTL